MDSIFTRLSDELSAEELEDYNDVPLTQEELNDLYALDEELERNKMEEQKVISRVLEKVGVNLYEYQYQEYC